jgi:hypothetical protein
LITNDVKNAFDNVSRARLLALLRKQLPRDTMSLVKKVVSRRDGSPGIRQGCPLSPLLLNVYLDAFLDRPWKTLNGHIPLVRYADDLLALCTSEQEAIQTASQLAAPLDAVGMHLKYAPVDSIGNLNAGQPIDWLGFRVRWSQDTLSVRLSKGIWDHLRGSLIDHIEKSDAPIIADQTLTGWFSQIGPCYLYEDVQAVVQQAKALAAQMGFRETSSEGKLRQLWKKSFIRWRCLHRRREVQMQHLSTTICRIGSPSFVRTS